MRSKLQNCFEAYYTSGILDRNRLIIDVHAGRFFFQQICFLRNMHLILFIYFSKSSGGWGGRGGLIPQPLSLHWPLKCDMCVGISYTLAICFTELKLYFAPFQTGNTKLSVASRPNHPLAKKNTVLKLSLVIMGKVVILRYCIINSRDSMIFLLTKNSGLIT